MPPEIAGGGGFTFEDAPVAIYLGALLGEESTPGLKGRIVTRVAVQQAASGEPLDDLIVDGIAPDETRARLSLQTKRELTISAAASNTDFREIVTRAWKTLLKPGFREDIDRVGFVTGTMADASRRALEDVCEWARDSLTPETFLARFQTGSADEQKRGVLNTFRQILGGYPDGKVDDAGVFRLLRHFVAIKPNVLHDGAIDDTNAVERLRAHLADPAQADALWDRLRVIAREAASRAGEFDRAALVREFHGAFRLAGARSLQTSLKRIDEEAALSLADIPFQIDGVEIERTSVSAAIDTALASHRFVQIVGLPGTGKSAALREYAEGKKKGRRVLFIKSDRLTGPNWTTYAQSIGLPSAPLEDLLTEIAATGHPILFIDGIDRVEVPNRGIVSDLIGSILRSDALARWKIIATSRDNGIEPLRTWLPPALFGDGGIGSVEVKAFDDDEATRLAEAKPVLRRLLFGEARVREIARRPFFASVLARALPQTGDVTAPGSEIELIEAWWARGGYDSDGSRASHRQRALIALAKAGAMTLGRRIRLDGIDLNALTELKNDGIIKDVRMGHSVQFAHDIFFEWSFLHLLIEHEDNWIAQISAVGEPPVLGRTVELLSQATFSNFENWDEHLRRLEGATIRPQWTRAWLTAPFGSSQFVLHESKFTDATLRNDAVRFSRLAVWFQAEKTRANPRFLDRSKATEALSPREMIRYADTFAWPSDVASWRRFCGWILRNIARCPFPIIPDIVSAFEVWQNMLGDYPNAVSTDLIAVVATWLEDLEDREHSEKLSFAHGPWNALESGERKELEDRLRNMLLRASRVEINRVHDYLKRVEGRRRLRDEAFNKIIAWTTILAEHHAQDVVDLTLAELKDDLPAEVAARPDHPRMLSRSFDAFDWHELAIRDGNGQYFPASPLREPFASLFAAAPAEALALVRQVTNHTITAWRQLHDLTRGRQGTPIPLVLDFPWGKQTFWGDGRVYMWARGHWAAAPVLCGLMALEKWAFAEVERGRDVDEVIRDVVTSHDSCAVLNIAVALFMESQRASEVTFPLATSQTLWHWDIGRFVGESSATANLIGFMKPSDLPHAESVRAANNRPARRVQIQWLSPLFVLNSDEKLRGKAQNAIQAFPRELPFEYEEEKSNAARVKSLGRTAEIWSQAGKADNYTASPSPDGKGTLIGLENPTASDPDVVATVERSAKLNAQLTLLNWIHDSFEKRNISDRLPLAEALERARKIDRARLFENSHGKDHTLDLDQSVVAGVAAIAVLYAEQLAPADVQWSKDILLRAYKTPEHRGEMWFAGSALLHHPCLYSAKGLSALVRRGVDADNAQIALLSLAGNPLEKVSEAALDASLSLWDVDANFAWITLNLAIHLSVGSRDKPISPYGYDHATQLDRLSTAVDVALGELKLGKPLSTLQAIPAPWVFAPPRPRTDGFSGGKGSKDPVWRDPDEFLRWDFLPKILGSIPIEAVMADGLRRPAFISFCYELLKWTLERIDPSWRTDKPKRRDRQTNLFEWRRVLFKLLAKVSLHLEIDEVQRRVLDPVFALDDEIAAALVEPFVNWIVVADILDAPQISPRSIPLLKTCLNRVLKDTSWTSARHRDGQLFGFDVPHLVQLFTFTTIEHAPLAARFANGDWREVQVILPIVDQFVREVGDIPDVMLSFLTLCERAVEHYPAAAFVEQVTAVIDRHERTPVGWRHSTIPGRVAGLIHSFAEKSQPLPAALAHAMLCVLDRLVDMGDRRSAALQTSEIFKDVRVQP
jgi:hypothetical protein